MKKFGSALLVFIVILAGFNFITAEEGMFTPDKIKFLRLDKLGMKIDPAKIFNPGKKGLQEAILLLGGGTGEFVSQDGLILTNHHVAFDALTTVSSVETDYSKDGFVPDGLEEEISVKDLDARILRRYENVTAKVLKGLNGKTGAFFREETIRLNKEKIIKSAVDKDPLLEYSVESYYNGNEFYLVGYFRIRDIRISFIPPASIGVFGGDIDNWMWPRHTGDFAFLRAYVDKNGNGAPYSFDNVPYKPKTWLKTSKKGVKEDDFVFIMGYPAVTYRYGNSNFIESKNSVELPFIINILKERLKVFEAAAKKSPELNIQYSGMIKNYNNSLKNYVGTLEGFKKLNTVDKRREEEEKFLKWVKSGRDRKKLYGDIISELDKKYKKQRKYAIRENIIVAFNQSKTVMAALDILKNAEDPADNLDKLITDTEIKLKTMFMPLETANFRLALSYAGSRDDENRVPLIKEMFYGSGISDIKHEAATKASEILDFSRELGILNDEKRAGFYKMNSEELLSSGEILFEIADMLNLETAKIGVALMNVNNDIAELERRLTEAKMQYWDSIGKDVYPDANRTLRFSYGHIKGYSPRDAVYYKPFTTMKGVIEKETGLDPFEVPELLKKIYDEKDFNGLSLKKLGAMPVNFLSTNDITGGSSGSPVLNAKGELVGCAFDGNWEAITSDYEYIPELTRCINVDVRYILLITEKYGAGQLLKEMKVK